MPIIGQLLWFWHNSQKTLWVRTFRYSNHLKSLFGKEIVLATYLGIAFLWVGFGAIGSAIYWIYSQKKVNKGRSLGEIIESMAEHRRRYMIILVMQAIIFFLFGLAIFFIPEAHNWIDRLLGKQ